MSPTRYPSLAHRKQTFKRAEAELNRSLREARNPAPAPEQKPVTYAENLLPDLPGLVHGIVASDPVWVIQCDGCGRLAVGDLDPRGRRTTLVIQFCGIQFGHRADDPRRMCGRCRIEAGWEDFDTQQLRERPGDLAVGESYLRERDQALFDVEEVR